jgi:hypothetical protein
MKNRPLPSSPSVPPATRAEVERFLKGLQQFRAKGDHPLDEAEVRKYDEAGVKQYLDKMTVGSQQGIARRIVMDILKSPTKDISDKSKRKPTKTKKTSSKVKSKRASKKTAKRPAVKKKAKKKRAGGRR